MVIATAWRTIRVYKIYVYLVKREKKGGREGGKERIIIARVREHVCGHDHAFTRRNADGPLRVDERSFYRKHALSGN